MRLLPSTVRTVIIPAAGKGTRMFPVTKVTAKELLPVYDRPVIQFAIEEAIAAGASRIIVVVNAEKPAIRELLGDFATRFLALNSGEAEIVYVTQNVAAGLGHAVLCCKGLTTPGAFGVILPDDFIEGQRCMADMVRHYESGNMVAAMNVQPSETSKYGIFLLDGAPTDTCIPARGMVEKPTPGQAPSTMAAVGRYILDPMIFNVLEETETGAGGELQLTDAIASATRSVPLMAFRFSGVRYDCGSHDGLLAASNARQGSLKTGDAEGSASALTASVVSGSAGMAGAKDHTPRVGSVKNGFCHATG